MTRNTSTTKTVPAAESFGFDKAASLVGDAVARKAYREDAQTFVREMGRRTIIAAGSAIYADDKAGAFLADKDADGETIAADFTRVDYAADMGLSPTTFDLYRVMAIVACEGPVKPGTHKALWSRMSKVALRSPFRDYVGGLARVDSESGAEVIVRVGRNRDSADYGKPLPKMTVAGIKAALDKAEAEAARGRGAGPDAATKAANAEAARKAAVADAIAEIGGKVKDGETVDHLTIVGNLLAAVETHLPSLTEDEGAAVAERVATWPSMVGTMPSEADEDEADEADEDEAATA